MSEVVILVSAATEVHQHLEPQLKVIVEEVGGVYLPFFLWEEFADAIRTGSPNPKSIRLLVIDVPSLNCSSEPVLDMADTLLETVVLNYGSIGFNGKLIMFTEGREKPWLHKQLDRDKYTFIHRNGDPMGVYDGPIRLHLHW